MNATAAGMESLVFEKMRLIATKQRTLESFDMRILTSGVYIHGLRKWGDEHTWPQKQLLVLRSEDLFARTQATMARVQAFLGLEAPFPAHALRMVRNKNPIRKSRPSRRLNQTLDAFFAPYNEELYDLFTDSPGSPAPLAVVEENGVTKIRGLTKRVVASEEEALAMFFSGEAARSTARHTLNDQSSRSHCIFTLYLETRQGGDADERVIQSKINLVDLAGSERTKKTDVSGQTLIEASYINKSLTFL